jgi:hypothetical protein
MAGSAPQPQNGSDSARLDPRTGLPLPDPYPDYITCPKCGEREVEVWCYQTRVRCHNCGAWIPHEPAICRGTSAICRPLVEREERESGPEP